jgi:hypothetical protein
MPGVSIEKIDLFIADLIEGDGRSSVVRMPPSFSQETHFST